MQFFYFLLTYLLPYLLAYLLTYLLTYLLSKDFKISSRLEPLALSNYDHLAIMIISNYFECLDKKISLEISEREKEHDVGTSVSKE